MPFFVPPRCAHFMRVSEGGTNLVLGGHNCRCEEGSELWLQRHTHGSQNWSDAYDLLRLGRLELPRAFANAYSDSIGRGETRAMAGICLGTGIAIKQWNKLESCKDVSVRRILPWQNRPITFICLAALPSQTRQTGSES